MNPILKRQERISKYIIDINNKTYISIIAKRRQRQRNTIPRHKEEDMALYSNYKQDSIIYDRMASSKKRKNTDILFTEHLQ